MIAIVVFAIDLCNCRVVGTDAVISDINKQQGSQQLTVSSPRLPFDSSME